MCIFSEGTFFGKNMSVPVIYYLVASIKMSLYKSVKWMHLTYHPVSKEGNLLFNLVYILWLHKSLIVSCHWF